MVSTSPGTVSYAFPIIVLFALASVAEAGNYRNFRVAVYARAYEVEQMKDPAWLESRWAAITSGLKVDKIYLETHRDGVVPDQATLDAAKQFFKSKGVETAGGIATVVNERNRFETFVYTNPEHRKKLREIVEYTARNFDEIIVDDFFFTSSKTESDIAAKGDKSWTRFRLDLMAEVSRDLSRPRQESQPAGEGGHQVPQLVRALPVLGLQPGRRAQDLRRRLHRHRNARPDQRQPAPAAVPWLRAGPLPGEHQAGRQRRRLGGYRRLARQRALWRATLAHPFRQGAGD